MYQRTPYKRLCRVPAKSWTTFAPLGVPYMSYLPQLSYLSRSAAFVSFLPARTAFTHGPARSVPCLFVNRAGARNTFALTSLSRPCLLLASILYGEARTAHQQHVRRGQGGTGPAANEADVA